MKFAYDLRIYAWKQLTPNMSDAETEYVFNVAERSAARTRRSS